MRRFRSSLKLPTRVQSQSFCLVDKTPNDPGFTSHNDDDADDADDADDDDDTLYAYGLADVVARYSQLRVLDVTNVWKGSMAWFNDPTALDKLMFALLYEADSLHRIIAQPHTSNLSRYLLEVTRGVTIEPALTPDVMAFLAAGNAYGMRGDTTEVKFKVESESLTNKAHYYSPVRATTPGGSEFEIFWKDRSSNMDPVWLQECFVDKPEFRNSLALGPDGDDFIWDHLDFQQYYEAQEAEILAGWKQNLDECPFAHLLRADNSCDVGCCSIKLVKKGEDFRVCDCKHKRPVFVSQDDHDGDLCVCSRDLQEVSDSESEDEECEYEAEVLASAYNIFMKKELEKLKKSSPKLDHKGRFAAAAANWTNAKK